MLTRARYRTLAYPPPHIYHSSRSRASFKRVYGVDQLQQATSTSSSKQSRRRWTSGSCVSPARSRPSAPSRLRYAHACLRRRRPRSTARCQRRAPRHPRRPRPHPSTAPALAEDLARANDRGRDDTPELPGKASKLWSVPLHALHVPSTMRPAGAPSQAVSVSGHGVPPPMVKDRPSRRRRRVPCSGPPKTWC
jgi:hypothetical protein